MENVLPFIVAAAFIGVVGYFIVWKRIINKKDEPRDPDDSGMDV